MFWRGRQATGQSVAPAGCDKDCRDMKVHGNTAMHWLRWWCCAAALAAVADAGWRLQASSCRATWLLGA